jgi:hypothetical protein
MTVEDYIAESTAMQEEMFKKTVLLPGVEVSREDDMSGNLKFDIPSLSALYAISTQIKSLSLSQHHRRGASTTSRPRITAIYFPCSPALLAAATSQSRKESQPQTSSSSLKRHLDYRQLRTAWSSRMRVMALKLLERQGCIRFGFPIKSF